MLTYSFDNRGSDSLYEYLYKQIKNDIFTGKLAPYEKLPSKRALAKHLNISTITVENAYSQLAAEGYIYSVPKSGFFVSDIIPDSYKADNDNHGKAATKTTGDTSGITAGKISGDTSGITAGTISRNISGKTTGKISEKITDMITGKASENDGKMSGNTYGITSEKMPVQTTGITAGKITGNTYGSNSEKTSKINSGIITQKTLHRESHINTTNDNIIDFVSNYTAPENFPFSIWTKLMRETMAENKDILMIKSPSTGVFELRSAIADYLYQFRGIDAKPDQIVVGAGTEYLYGLIIQLLGHDRIYAIEDPGYRKISRIYGANRVKCVHVPLDDQGINIDELERSGADVVHITPSHHFPTGLVTPISRRYELLSWASKSDDRYIIEDDYDSEFRLQGKPIPAMQSIDVSQKVIYMNTFSKSLSSTVRISFMVLPESLMERYNKELSFYSCTVSNFEQYTLAKFIEQGYLEKHINRMRNHYRKIRDDILLNIKKRLKEKKGSIMEEDAGLHFLLKVDTKLSDEELVIEAAKKGINISCLSQYYHNRSNAVENTLIINYSGIKAEKIEESVNRLFEIF